MRRMPSVWTCRQWYPLARRPPKPYSRKGRIVLAHGHAHGGGGSIAEMECRRDTRDDGPPRRRLETPIGVHPPSQSDACLFGRRGHQAPRRGSSVLCFCPDHGLQLCPGCPSGALPGRPTAGTIRAVCGVCHGEPNGSWAAVAQDRGHGQKRAIRSQRVRRVGDPALEGHPGRGKGQACPAYHPAPQDPTALRGEV